MQLFLNDVTMQDKQTKDQSYFKQLHSPLGAEPVPGPAAKFIQCR